MKAPDRFVITITGRQLPVTVRENISPWIGNYLAALMMGDDVPLESFRAWGVVVTVEEDPG